jgi:Fe-S oxidoreductase
MLDKFDHEITYCTYCPKLCRFACPVTNAEARETVTPTTKMNFMYMLRQGSIQLDSEVADIFYRCAGCLTCRAYCKHRINVPDVIEAARRAAVDKGVQPPSIDRHIKTFSEHLNPYGERLSAKLRELGLDDRMNKPAPYIYFIGCTTLFHYGDLAKAAVKLLDRCGIDFAVYSGGSLCCGAPALLAGDRKSFRRAAKRNIEILNQYETIITGCPSCMATLKFKYPENGARLKSNIVHLTQIIAENAQSGRLDFKPRANARVMYHDPCHLAKYFGVFEPPRELLGKMFYPDNIIEFSWNRDKNYCCGGGGLLPVTAPKVSREISRKRLKEFYEAAPDILATACPTCERTFHRADPAIQVKDVISLVAEQIKD